MEENKKIIILAIGRRNFDKAQKFKKRLLKDNKNVLIVTDCYLENPNFNETKTIKYYQDFFRHIKYQEDLSDTRNFINSIEKIRLNKDLTFENLVTYQGVSLWKMSTRYLLAELVLFFKYLRLSSEIINFELPQEIILIGEGGNIGNIFKAICFNKGIIVNLSKTSNFNKLFKRIILNLSFPCKDILYLFKILYYKCLSFYYSRNKKYNRNNVIIFFIYLARYFDSVLSLVNKYRPHERLVINMPFSDCKERLKNENIEYEEFSAYSLTNIFNRKINKYLNKVWKVINRNYCFQSALNSKGINTWFILKDMFWSLIFQIFPDQIRNIETMRRIILTYRPKCIVVTDYSCEVVLPAKSFSVPTVAISASSVEEFSCTGGIISDYIAVWGNYWNESILKLGARTQQLFVVGPPKLDLVLNRSFHKDSLVRDLELNKKFKTVLYIGTYPSHWFCYEDYLYQLRMVYRGLKNIENVNLVTKMHPHALDFTLYKKMAKEENCKNMLILHDYDIWELLYCSDLVISDFSTISYEAIVMDKIVIMYTYTYKYFRQDIWDFEKTGAALFINDFSELEGSVRNALEDQKTQAILSENRKKYILEHAWPLDGRAGERLKELIEQITVNSFFNIGSYDKNTNEFFYNNNKEKTYA